MFPQIEETAADWRFEYKYRLSFQEYLRVRSAVLPYLKKDKYTLSSPQKKYLVRSLYFDTASFSNFIEKVNGDCDRVKLRIRTYNNTPEQAHRLRVELKARKGITVEKHSTWIGHQDYQSFLAFSHWPDAGDEVLSEFERYVHLKAQRPKIIVEYLREGYITRGKEPIRLTFDHKVHSAHAESLFPAQPFFRPHHPGKIILEIKCVRTQPHWLRQLVFQQGLRITANSKYTQGIEVARRDVITQSWSY